MTVRSEVGLLPRSSLWTRLFRGGVTLTTFEGAVLLQFLGHLPEHLREVVDAQLAACNLIQRDPESLELRFYPMNGATPDWSHLPALPIESGEVKLLSLSIQPGTSRDTVRADFWAVDRRFFMVEFGSNVASYAGMGGMVVKQVTEVWRLNLSSEHA
ncbi:MAG: hypothetical protein ACREMH_11195 [Gemmatimonadales bacterium]